MGERERKENLSKENRKKWVTDRIELLQFKVEGLNWEKGMGYIFNSTTLDPTEYFTALGNFIQTKCNFRYLVTRATSFSTFNLIPVEMVINLENEKLRSLTCPIHPSSLFLELTFLWLLFFQEQNKERFPLSSMSLFLHDNLRQIIIIITSLIFVLEAGRSKERGKFDFVHLHIHF